MAEDYMAITKFIKILSITALCCTVLLFAALLGASATPGKQSGEFTDKVTDAVDSAWNLSDKVSTVTTVQSINLKVKAPNPYYFTGETVQLKSTLLPSGAVPEAIEYSVDDDTLAEVSADGLVTFLKKGRFQVTAKLVSDNSIKAKYTFVCAGENPLQDDAVDKMTFSLSSEKGSALTMQAGERKEFSFNDGKTDPSIVDYTVEDENIVGVFQGIVYGRKVGETRVLATLTARGKTRSVYIPLTVTEGTQAIISEINLKDYVFIHKSILEDYRNLIENNGEIIECFVISDNEEVISVKQNELYANKMGSATLTFISAYDESVRAQKTFTVEPIKPTSMKIIGHDVVTPGTYKYDARHYPQRYSSYVKWSVVSGKGTIDEDGNLTVKSYGKVVIRCQSTIDDSMFVDKEIQVKLYTGAYGFVRKLMGHGVLSALLGFGVFFVFYLFAKRKWTCVFSPIVTLAYAGLSELIQYFTPGRYCLLSDVLIDFIGSLIGIAIAIVVLFLVLLIWRIVSKKGYNKLRVVIKKTNYTNIFKKKFAFESEASQEITAVDDLNKNKQ